MTLFGFRGASGRRYEYDLCPITDARNLPQQDGIAIFAGGTLLAPKPVYISTADSMALFDLMLWTEAAEDHDASLLYVRSDLLGRKETPVTEVEDLIQGYAPAMNVGIVDKGQSQSDS
jgi:hypothetical protein